MGPSHRAVCWPSPIPLAGFPVQESGPISSRLQLLQMRMGSQFLHCEISGDAGQALQGERELCAPEEILFLSPH